jgi:ribosomal protein L37AE/L43A
MNMTKCRFCDSDKVEQTDELVFYCPDCNKLWAEVPIGPELGM